MTSPGFVICIKYGMARHVVTTYHHDIVSWHCSILILFRDFIPSRHSVVISCHHDNQSVTVTSYDKDNESEC